MSDKKTVKISDKNTKYLEDGYSVSEKRPRGLVKIYEKSTDGRDVSYKFLAESDQVTFHNGFGDGVGEDYNQHHKGPNLIVYDGRTWLMQRTMGQKLPTVIETRNVQDFHVSWFGLGTGGATPGDPLDPVQPEHADSELVSPAVINDVDPNCVDTGVLHPFDSIEYQQDPSNDNQYLIAKITTTIANTDANGSDGSTYYDLNEAGLYVSNSNDTSTFDSSSKILFARVTYSSIRKHSDREIVYIWSVYF